MIKRHLTSPIKGRALSQSDAIPKWEVDEITDRIDLMEFTAKSAVTPKPDIDLGVILASFESKLFELNKSLKKATRANRDTLQNFSEECAKTKESVENLNTELDFVIRREVG